MKHVIYVDGPDCCGKSTLISAIKREGDLVIHNGLYETPAQAYAAYIRQIQSFLAASQTKYNRLILDRGVLSEIVYGQVLRNTLPDAALIKTII